MSDEWLYGNEASRQAAVLVLGYSGRLVSAPLFIPESFQVHASALSGKRKVVTVFGDA